MRKVELIEQVLKPGNLVWGVCIEGNNWQSIVQEGIKPARVAENNPHAQAEICTGLLPKRGLPSRRYLNTGHHGPKGESPYTSIRAGVILSRERLLQEFPGQLEAVGVYFTGNLFWEDPNYDFSLGQPGTVFGIPISRQHTSPSYPDEVRICPGERELLIDPSFWDGIVVKRWHCTWLYSETEEAGRKLDLPVIDTGGNLLTMTLG